jgi:RNA polymerase sigma factor (TIGR02999 family)
MSRLEPGRWPDRKAFFAIAARAMRRILVDHARRRRASKRAGRKVTLDAGMLANDEGSPVDLLALDEALDLLSRTNAVHGRIIELHLFGGLSVNETAEVLAVTERTVYRHLRSARAWLQSELEDRGVVEVVER